MNDFPEITTEQIVARLRMIVAEPDSLCKTDLHYIEDAADELESKGDEIERLRAERDEARRSCCEYAAIVDGADTADGMESGRFYEIAMKYMKDRGWDCFKEEQP